MRRSARHAPGLAVIGCSTSGEITPDGIAAGHALAILLPACHFTVVSATIPRMATAGMDMIAGEVDRLKRRLAEATGARPGQARFALCLIDGMSFAEERVTAALHWALADIPLIGGSAGDDLRFERTPADLRRPRHGRRRGDRAGLRPCCPSTIFKTDNFIPTEAKLVVTASDPERRTCHRAQRQPGRA